ncbi:hypothetical protein MNV49_001053 [Pseudohyphozyma bogoriensis]|nr:hypothetical protein MNV49_001053 [Pseudohyphozyma bogoriensis]
MPFFSKHEEDVNVDVDFRRDSRTPERRHQPHYSRYEEDVNADVDFRRDFRAPERYQGHHNRYEEDVNVDVGYRKDYRAQEQHRNHQPHHDNYARHEEDVDVNLDVYKKVYHAPEHHKAQLSHEMIGGAAAFSAMKAYEDHQRSMGKPVSHAIGKEIIAGIAGKSSSSLLSTPLQEFQLTIFCVTRRALAGAEVDKLFETKGLDFFDRQKAKHHAERQAQKMLREEDW